MVINSLRFIATSYALTLIILKGPISHLATG
jgi:hypothetical protein